MDEWNAGPKNGSRPENGKGRQFMRPPRSSDGWQQDPGKPPRPMPPAEEVDQLPATPLRSGGQFKSPLPTRPGAAPMRRSQDNLPPYEDVTTRDVYPGSSPTLRPERSSRPDYPGSREQARSGSRSGPDWPGRGADEQGTLDRRGDGERFRPPSFSPNSSRTPSPNWENDEQPPERRSHRKGIPDSSPAWGSEERPPERRRSRDSSPAWEMDPDGEDRPPARRSRSEVVERDQEMNGPMPPRRRRPPVAPGDPGGPPRSGKMRKPPSKKRQVMKALGVLFLLLVCTGTSYFGAKAYRVYVLLKNSTGQALPPVPLKNGPQATPLPTDITSLNHFNLLLLGSDNDAKFTTGAVLTQTVIVVRIDIKNHKVTMVSLPRDLWVHSDTGACCYKLDEISGNEIGNAQTPQQAKLNGFAHTEAAIESDFGIPISAYAWVGLDGFVKVIDTVGGVDVDVLHPIVDDAYPNDVDNADPYSYKRLDIPAGPQHLDGKTALEYVRSRHSDLTGDFGRSARQQSVLVALKKKLEDPTILTKLDEFATDLQGSVLTDLQIGQIIELANWARGLQSSDINQLVLSPPDYGQLGTEDGKSVVEGNWTAIQQKVAEVFPDSSNIVDMHNLTTSESQTIQTEGARILVENGSGTPGLAANLEALMKAEGFNVVGAQNANSTSLEAQILNYNPKTAGTSDLLGGRFHVAPLTPSTAPPNGVDIVIIIGSNVEFVNQ